MEKLSTLTPPPQTNILDVPPELLVRILSLTMESAVPFYLEHVMKFNISRNQKDYKRERDSADHQFPKDLDISQQQHLLDWVAVNSTCRGFREYGCPAFFSTKDLILGLPLLKHILSDTCPLSNRIKDAMFDNTRNIIVPERGPSVANQFLQLPAFNAFRRLRTISVRLDTRSDRSLWQDIKRGPTKTGLRGLDTIRHRAPDQLVAMLHDIGLENTETRIDLLIPDTHLGPTVVREVIGQFQSQVYPYLRFVACQKAKNRKSATP